MTTFPKIILGILGGVLCAVVIFGASLLPAGERALGNLGNIHGIPFPKHNGRILISEEMAHADIYLQEPVAFKELVLDVELEARHASSVHVGVRQDSFWLSYEKEELLSSEDMGRQTRRITIPLTDKLQEPDRSIDMMFFADTADGSEPSWYLHGISARTQYATPSFLELKDYVRSIVKKERAL